MNARTVTAEELETFKRIYSQNGEPPTVPDLLRLVIAELRVLGPVHLRLVPRRIGKGLRNPQRIWWVAFFEQCKQPQNVDRAVKILQAYDLETKNNVCTAEGHTLLWLGPEEDFETVETPW